MTQYESQYERMIKQPIPSLILTLALPTTISMLVTNIYNIADTYFVSTVGTSATGAVGIVFGLMAILQAFGFMFGHGAGANISRRLGAKPITMRRLYEEVLEQLNKVKKQIPEESEYVKALISQMDEVVAKINHQNERYDALNKKLSEIETSKDDEEVRERLVKENQDKDALINSQQNELNKASSTIARLRDDIEKKDKEMKRMGDRIESLEDKIISVATENKKEAESKAEPQESQSVSQAEKKMVDTVAVPQNMQAVANGIPVYYQIPVVDGTGNVVQRLPIERSVRKSSNSGVASLFARLTFKKKSRADIVKLVASGDLVPAQLVQIKSAIEKGLTETQLIELITNNISAEKMKEIIEIAVLENSMAD